MKVRTLAVLFLSLLFVLMVFGGYIKVLMVSPGKAGSSLLISVVLLAVLLLALLRRINFDGFLTILLVSIAVFMTSLVLSALDMTETARYMLVFIAATVVYVVVFSYSFHFGYRTFMLPALVTFLIIVFSQLWQYIFPDQYHSFAQILLTDDAFEENIKWYLAGRLGGLAVLSGPGALCLILLASIVMASLFGKSDRQPSWTPGVKFFLLPVGIFSLTGIGILLSGYRIALISFCVWCFFGFYAILLSRRTSAFSKLLFILNIFVALPIAVYQLFLMFQEQSRFLSIYSRFDLWRTAIELFVLHPILGIGINNYRFYTETVGGVGILSEVTHAHNAWLQILAETGIVGMLVFLVGVYFCIRNNVLSVKIARTYREHNLLFLVGGTCAFGLYTLTSNPVHNQQNLLLFVVLQAIINSRLARAGMVRVLSNGKSTRGGFHPHPQLQRLAGHRRVPGVGAAADLSQLPHRGHRQRFHRWLHG